MDKLDILWSEREIRAVLQRYCRGLDRLDEELAKSAYHDDAHDDRGVIRGNAHDFVKQIIPVLRDAYSGTLHTLHGSTIEIDGDTAGVETYCTAYHYRESEGVKRVEQYAGRYVDRFERREGAWKIARRLVLIDWSLVQEVPLDPAEAQAGFNPSWRDRSDASYQVLPLKGPDAPTL
ncbi:nuclear transport factor 2 family protein [Streptomyces sp. NBC_01408]|uniref:nuclear transport factor 2 family protein n=1 Tax=Streptomyces sp. NBC_01408 TaxID=2903855 RepID=UPI002257A62D|nr:nuclear transport factor 2 family protein [Streptomyces sp. NBC_01408]MCX4695645.1 nuclear transport factor 2 family protein [Streptomyces sp. NBC_01408]